MKVFIINLEKDKNRLDNIHKQLQTFSFIDYEKIDAINGNELINTHGNILKKSQIGCFLSHIKAVYQIIKQNLNYALILEDDITLSEWFPTLNQIILTIPSDFDICWVGNSKAHWPRNTCNLIPDYDYKKLNFINDFVVKITDENIKDKNYPMGAYGLVISKNGAYKILKDLKLDLELLNMENIFLDKPIDNYYVENINFKKYMTIPSIILHCYNFGSYTNSINQKMMTNPYDNIWKRYSIYEKNILVVLNNVYNTFKNHNIDFSIIYGTLLGYMRNKKFISYDDDIDIVINSKDLNNFKNIINILKSFCNIYVYKKPQFKNSLYYKIYTKNGIYIENKEYTWPFIDIFVYTYENNTLTIGNDKIENVSNDTMHIYLESHNTNDTYNSKIFKDSTKILDILYKDWKNKCYTSSWNHMKETKIKDIYNFNCINIIPNYKNNKNNKKKSYIIFLIIIGIILTIIYLYFKLQF